MRVFPVCTAVLCAGRTADTARHAGAGGRRPARRGGGCGHAHRHVDALEQSASSLAGSDYALPFTLETRPLRATASQFLTADELEAGLIEASGELDTLAVISVSGEQAGICRSAEDAQALLDRVKAQYTTSADENADFMQEVRVDTVVAQTSLVSDFGALYDYLSPRLDVTATRSVPTPRRSPMRPSPAKTTSLTRPTARPCRRAARVRRSSLRRSRPWTARSTAAPSLRAQC